MSGEHDEIFDSGREGGDKTAAVYIAKKKEEGKWSQVKMSLSPVRRWLGWLGRSYIRGRAEERKGGHRRRFTLRRRRSLSPYFLENIGGPRAPNALQELSIKKTRN